jgi:hypothetical protein
MGINTWFVAIELAITEGRIADAKHHIAAWIPYVGDTNPDIIRLRAKCDKAEATMNTIANALTLIKPT